MKKRSLNAVNVFFHPSALIPFFFPSSFIPHPLC